MSNAPLITSALQFGHQKPDSLISKIHSFNLENDFENELIELFSNTQDDYSEPETSYSTTTSVYLGKRPFDEVDKDDEDQSNLNIIRRLKKPKKSCFVSDLDQQLPDETEAKAIVETSNVNEVIDANDQEDKDNGENDTDREDTDDYDSDSCESLDYAPQYGITRTERSILDAIDEGLILNHGQRAVLKKLPNNSGAVIIESIMKFKQEKDLKGKPVLCHHIDDVLRYAYERLQVVKKEKKERREVAIAKRLPIWSYKNTRSLYYESDESDESDSECTVYEDEDEDDDDDDEATPNSEKTNSAEITFSVDNDKDEDHIVPLMFHETSKIDAFMDKLEGFFPVEWRTTNVGFLDWTKWYRFHDPSYKTTYTDDQIFVVFGIHTTFRTQEAKDKESQWAKDFGKVSLDGLEDEKLYPEIYWAHRDSFQRLRNGYYSPFS